MEMTAKGERPSIARHKRQFAWQILVPIILFAIVIITAAVFLATGGAAVTSPWADVSLIWLIIPFLFLAILVVALLGLLIFGLAKLLQITPIYTSKAEDLLTKIRIGARKVTDGSVKPIIWINQAGAAIKAIFKH